MHCSVCIATSPSEDAGPCPLLTGVWSHCSWSRGSWSPPPPGCQASCGPAPPACPTCCNLNKIFFLCILFHVCFLSSADLSQGDNKTTRCREDPIGPPSPLQTDAISETRVTQSLVSQNLFSRQIHWNRILFIFRYRRIELRIEYLNIHLLTLSFLLFLGEILNFLWLFWRWADETLNEIENWWVYLYFLKPRWLRVRVYKCDNDSLSLPTCLIVRTKPNRMRPFHRGMILKGKKF